MIFKDLLVFLDDGETNLERANTAINLAKQHGARLTGVALGSMRPLYAPNVSEDALDVMSKKLADKLTREFCTLAEQSGVEAEGVVIYGDASESAEKLGHYARNHDLVILSQPNPSKRNYAWLTQFAEDVLLFSGRPVLFMPYIGRRKVTTENVMIAWDGTPAASRAVHDAIPCLAAAKDVVVLIVESKSPKAFNANKLLDGLMNHLRNHGANARIVHAKPGGNDVATVILNQLSDNGSDLLVMGGYGTPKIQQKIFGGVSSTLLSSMVVPILMSH